MGSSFRRDSLEQAEAILLPTRYRRFLLEALTLAREGWQDSDVKTLIERVQCLDSVSPANPEEARAQYLEFRNDLKAADFWSRLLSDRESSDRYSLVQGLADALTPLQNLDPTRVSYGIALPLPAASNAEGMEVGILLELVFALLRRPGVWPSFLWSSGGPDSHPRLLVFYNLPSPKSFTVLVDREADDDSVYDLGNLQLSARESLKNKMQESLKETLDKEEASMAELLRALEYNHPGILK
jgi:hypothetical protein